MSWGVSLAGRFLGRECVLEVCVAKVGRTDEQCCVVWSLCNEGDAVNLGLMAYLERRTFAGKRVHGEPQV